MMEMLNRRLINKIEVILDDSSGGIKFIELLNKLIKIMYEGEYIIPENFPEKLEKLIRKNTEFKVLDYTWKSMNRSKMFVYTP
jgi:hypothetical protein